MSKSTMKRRGTVSGEKRPPHRLALADEIARLEKELIGWSDGSYAEAEASRVRDLLRERRRQMAARKVGSNETLDTMLAVADEAEGPARDAAVKMVAALGLTEAEVLLLLKTKQPAAVAEAEPQPASSPPISESDQLMAELEADLFSA